MIKTTNLMQGINNYEENYNAAEQKQEENTVFILIDNSDVYIYMVSK